MGHSRFNHPEPEKTGDLQDTLKDALTDVQDEYDAILCDTPPSLETLSWLPAVAAAVALTPTPAEALFQPRLAIHEAFAKTLRESYGDLVLSNVVP